VTLFPSFQYPINFFIVMSKYYLFPQATTHIPAVWAGFEIIISFYFIGHPFALLRPSISGLMKKVGKFVGKT